MRVAAVTVEQAAKRKPFPTQRSDGQPESASAAQRRQLASAASQTSVTFDGIKDPPGVIDEEVFEIFTSKPELIDKYRNVLLLVKVSPVTF